MPFYIDDEGQIVPTGCDWPGCKNTEPLVLTQPREEVWCVEHLGDDILPALRSGARRVCRICRDITIWELDEGEPKPHARGHEVIALHDWCRRRWVIQQLRADIAAEETRAAPRGAYARRAAVQA